MHRSLILMSVLILVFSAPALAEKEPSFDGRSATEWARKLRTGRDAEWHYAALELQNGGSEAVPVLIWLMKESSLGLQRRAATIAWKMGAPARPAIPALLGLLEHPETIVNLRAADALIALNGPAEPLVKALTALLTDANRSVRWSAANRLTRLGPAAAPALPALVKLTGDSYPQTRNAAALAIGATGEAARPFVPALVIQARGGSSGYRESAITALGALGPVAEMAVPVLVDLMKKPDGEFRFRASEALGRIGHPALPSLLPLTKSLSAPTRFLAAHALSFHGPEATRALPILRQALRGEDRGLRRVAAEDLARLGEVARPALEDLFAAIRGDDLEVSQHAAVAIGGFGRDPGVRNRVAKLIASGTEQEKRFAVIAVGEMGEFSGDLVPALVTLATTRSDMVGDAAEKAIDRLGVHARSALIVALADEDPRIVFTSIHKLLRMKEEARPAVPALLAVLAREEPVHRDTVIRTLVAIGPAVRGDLVAALGHESANVRSAVADALGRLGRPAAPGEVAALEKAAKDGDPTVRAAADAALSRVRPLSGGRAAELVELLDAPDASTRERATKDLLKLGVAALPALIARLEKGRAPEAVIAVTGALGSDAVPAVGALLGYVHVWRFRRTLIVALRSIGRPQVVLGLIGLLAHEKTYMRRAAVTALGDLGAMAVDSLPYLKPLAEKDPSEVVRKAAAQAIEEIGSAR